MSNCSLPNSMRYITITHAGEPNVMRLASGPLPQPDKGEVLIHVAAVGINHADLAQRAGKYLPPKDASPIMGLEVAGTIVAIGQQVTERTIGEKVCVLTHGGGYAEYVTAPASLCLDVPEGFTLYEAAALPEAAMTVWSNIFMLGHLKAGQTLLVHGGSSGIGTFAVQYALAMGCQVIATAGSDMKCQFIRRLGADLVINYRQHDFVTEVLHFTQQRGVDVILDMVGGTYTIKNIQILAREGRIVQIAWLQGNQATIDLAELARRQGVLTGSLLRPRPLAEKQQIVEQLKHYIWPLYQAGIIKPVIDKIYPLHHVIQAHQKMESSQHIGKLILSLN